ncbi:unnamed protein product, partial [Amoebophrya sp. A25]|eukprot:GSA25T00006851001.1
MFTATNKKAEEEFRRKEHEVRQLMRHQQIVHIQKHYRGRLARKRVSEDKARRSSAATSVQKVYRGSKGRRQAGDLRQFREDEKRRQEREAEREARSKERALSKERAPSRDRSAERRSPLLSSKKKRSSKGQNPQQGDDVTEPGKIRYGSGTSGRKRSPAAKKKSPLRPKNLYLGKPEAIGKVVRIIDGEGAADGGPRKRSKKTSPASRNMKNSTSASSSKKSPQLFYSSTLDRGDHDTSSSSSSSNVDHDSVEDFMKALLDADTSASNVNAYLQQIIGYSE